MRTVHKFSGLGFLLCSAFTMAEPSSDGQSLAQAASDPTASLMNVQIGDWYTQSYWNLPDESANTINLRSAYPFQWGESKHILRATVPIITDQPSGSTGLSDSTVFDLMVFDTSWGRWGAGAVALLPTGGTKRGAEKWGLGPAIGFVRSQPKTLMGLFNQNVFTVAGDDDREDINISVLQPIFNHQLGSGWAIGASEMSITYDWENSRWISLPLGIAVQKMTKPGGLPVQWNFQYEYNFADDAVGPKSIYRITAKFLFPAF